MKLERIHVDNFGILHDFDYSFHDGLNVIRSNNGNGKSTLVSFIRIMFYGFDNERKRDDAENERHRFKPWQGGTYGGEIVFSVNEKKYRMIRSFSSSARNDQFRLYDAYTNRKSTDFTENCGRSLFGIDAFSFEKTIYVGQQDCRTEVTSDVHAKIGNVSEESADMSSYESAQTALKNLMNKLTPDRKTGSLNRMRTEADSVYTEIQAIPSLRKQLSELENEKIRRLETLKQLRETDSALAEKIKSSSRRQSERTVQQQYRLLKEEENKAEEDWNKEKNFFNGDIPAVSDVESASRAVDRMRILQEMMRSNHLNRQESDRYAYLQSLFRYHYPDQKECDEIRQNAAALRNAQQQYDERRLSADEAERLRRYRNQFQEKPDLGKIDECIEKCRTMSSLKAAKTRNPRGKSVKKTAGLVMAAAGILLSVVILLSGHDMTPFQMVLVLTLIMAGLFFCFYQKKDSSPEKIPADTESDIRLVLENAGMHYSPDTALNSLYALHSATVDYQRLLERESVYSEGSAWQEQDRLKRELKAKLSVFYRTDDQTDFVTLSIQLEKDVEEYARLYSRCRTMEKNTEEYRILQNNLAVFDEKYHLKSGDDPLKQLRTIRDHVLAVNQAAEELQYRRDVLRKFIDSNDISSFRQAEDKPDDDLNELSEAAGRTADRIQEITVQLRDLQNQIDALQQKIRELTEKSDQRNQLMEQMKKDMHLYRIASETQKYLEKAKDAFSSRYMNPVRKSFDSYYEELTGEKENHFILDSDLNLSLSIHAGSFDIRLLSDGYQDLVGLCRRMAMTDTMYRKEKPFLILDDPFVSLDNDKLAAGLKFLEKIAENYQVIYLTCHSSRCPQHMSRSGNLS